jgi:hypothetical protein
VVAIDGRRVEVVVRTDPDRRLSPAAAELLADDPSMLGEALRYWSNAHRSHGWPDPEQLSPAARKAGARVVLLWRLARSDPAYEGKVAARWNADGSFTKLAICPRPRCLGTFRPSGAGQRHCSKACRDSASKVTRWAKDELEAIALRDRVAPSCWNPNCAAPRWRNHSRCQACYKWWNEHGREEERPRSLIEKAARRARK